MGVSLTVNFYNNGANIGSQTVPSGGPVNLAAPGVSDRIEILGSITLPAVTEADFVLDNIIYTVDTPPAVTITGPAGPVSGPFTATFTFDEDVTGFALGDIDVANASASDFMQVSGQVYTALITPDDAFTPPAGVTITIDVGAGAAQDLTGNDNTPAAQYSVLYINELLEGSVRLVVTTSPSDAGDSSFEFTSTIAEFSDLTLTTSNGSAEATAADLTEGAYTITQIEQSDWRLDSIQCTGDLDGGNVVSLEDASVEIDLDGGESIVCTFAFVRDDDAIIELTTSTISDFMETRGDFLLSTEPNLIQRLRDRNSTGGGANSFSANSSRMGTRASFSASALEFARRAPREAPANLRGDMHESATATSPYDLFALRHDEARTDAHSGPVAAQRQPVDPRTPGPEVPLQPASPFDVWAQAEYFDVNRDSSIGGGESSFGVAYVGIDYSPGEDVLFGALVQWDWGELDIAATGASASGHGWMAGPYIAGRLFDNVYIQTRAAYGQSDNDVSPLGTYTDDFETERYLINATVTGDFFTNGFRVSPSVAAQYFEETQDSYVDSLGITIPSTTVSIARLRAGPEVAYRFQHGDDGYIEPYASVSGIWDFDQDGLGVRDSVGELHADVVAGVNARLSGGALVSAEVGARGLGAQDFDATSARVWLRLPFG